MFTKPNQNSGIPIYVQVKEQALHAIELGAIKQGEQLPSVRALSEQLVINPNTVIKIYRELEMEGVIEIRHGLGAFVSSNYAAGSNINKIKQGTQAMQKLVEQLINKGLSTDEIRRVVEAELKKYQ